MDVTRVLQYLQASLHPLTPQLDTTPPPQPLPPVLEVVPLQLLAVNIGQRRGYLL
jgi:hypothetical protein